MKTPNPHPVGQSAPDRAPEDACRHIQRIQDAAALNMVLYAFCELRLADRLAQGPATGPELADWLRINADAPDVDVSKLERFLGVAEAGGLVTRSTQGYELTTAGRTLDSSAHGSMRPGVMWRGTDLSRMAMASLPSTILTGKPSALQGASGLYDCLQRQPAADQRTFDEFMSRFSDRIASHVATCSFRHIEGECAFVGKQYVVDVGGGRGTLLAETLRNHAHLRGVLVELDRVADEARDHLATAYPDLTGRYEVVNGDMFKEVPPRPQAVYLLSRVIHNYGNDQCAVLLKRLASAMGESGPGAELFLMEHVLPEDPQMEDARLHPSHALDMIMMALTVGGQERDLFALSRLLTDAGFILPAAEAKPDLPAGMTLVIARINPDASPPR
ncbi:methyltransferase [Nonomuraea sp. NPDC049400]|uniref:methyltransferase n=1 Tax=Nonomuraea sp. NPDC049400 TaxID=3364352 RepID=UPI0037B27A1C